MLKTQPTNERVLNGLSQLPDTPLEGVKLVNFSSQRENIWGDAVASNIIVQTIDPWPRAAGNRNIAFNGDVMQSAGERYRTGKVYTPKGLNTSSVKFENSGGGGSSGAAAQ